MPTCVNVFLKKGSSRAVLEMTFNLILRNNEENCSTGISLAYDLLKYPELKEKKA